jgi:hypothetical protein
MTLFDLEKTSPFKIQADFARWATFNFNEELVNSIVPSVMDEFQLPLFLLIIKNKHLLAKTKQPIEEFLKKLDSIEDQKYGEEVLKLFTKSGSHLMNSKNFLTSKDEFVSVNENDYVVRSHKFPIAIYNKLFSFMNEELNTKAIACKSYVAQKLAEKEDVEKVTSNEVTLKNGDVYKLIVVE